MKSFKGFTLIELMVAVTVLAILMGIALPAYTDYVIRARRADATAALMSAMNAMERFRANNFSYETAGAPPFSTNVPMDGTATPYYVLTIVDDATTYTITATSTGIQSDALGSTETLTINQNGVKRWTYSGSTENCWPTKTYIC